MTRKRAYKKTCSAARSSTEIQRFFPKSGGKKQEETGKRRTLPSMSSETTVSGAGESGEPTQPIGGGDTDERGRQGNQLTNASQERGLAPAETHNQEVSTREARGGRCRRQPICEERERDSVPGERGDQPKKVLCPVTMLIFLVFLIFGMGSVHGQFPRACASKELIMNNGSCCPDVNGKPCAGHGICITYKDTDALIKVMSNDDRLNWPRFYYQSSCQCYGNYDGYDCTKCKFGYYGKNCERKRIQKRKEIRQLTNLELKRFFSYLTLAKSTICKEHVIVATGDRHHLETYRFIDASVYDICAWMHYYAIKPIMRNSKFNKTRNFAHQGPAFLGWHRLLLLYCEREIQLLTGDEEFMFPYYDWSKDKDCTICDNDFLGENDLEGNINKHSFFASWPSICSGFYYEDAYCRSAITGSSESVLRKPARDPNARLPNATDVRRTLAFEKFDTEPFDRTSPRSFRNALEGFLNVYDQVSPDANMHNMFHDYMGGTMAQVPISANDPIFFLHHCFIDKIFELWLRKHPEATYPINNQLGMRVADCAVPFFPCYQNGHLLRGSQEFGYDYD